MSEADFSYTVTAVNGEDFADAVLADANEIMLTIPAPVARVFVYDGFGRPRMGRDSRGKYWQHRIDLLVARMKRRYDKRRAELRA